MVQKKSTGYKPQPLKFDIKQYAQSPNEAIPRQYFFAAFCSPRGCGKTYSVCQLIKAYEKDPPVNPETNDKAKIKTFVISPTYDQNDAFKSLKSIEDENVYRTYDNNVLEDILAKLKAHKDERDQYEKELAVYKKYAKMQKETDIDKLKPEELFLLEKIDFQPPEKVDEYSFFLVVDDMLGSKMFSTGKNPFVQLCIKNRHHRLNIIILSQHLKAVPKSLRGNVNVFWIGRFGSRSILPDLYEETASALCTEKEFEELYDAATEGKHGALVVDFTKPQDQRFSRSFEEYLVPGKPPQPL